MIARRRITADPATLAAAALWACCLFAVLLLGLVRWPAPSGVTPSVTYVTSSVASPCHVGQIKGSLGGLYHAPSSQWYAQTRHAVCFDTVAEAQRAGYRAADTPR